MAKTLTGAVTASLLLRFASALPLAGIELPAQAVPETEQVAPLTRRVIAPEPDALPSLSHRLRLAAVADHQLAAPIGTAKALPVYHPAEYLAEVTAGGYRYALQIDTGSSDTWFIKDGFTCLLSPHCNLGPVFKGDFPSVTTPSCGFLGSGTVVTETAFTAQRRRSNASRPEWRLLTLNYYVGAGRSKSI